MKRSLVVKQSMADHHLKWVKGDGHSHRLLVDVCSKRAGMTSDLTKGQGTGRVAAQSTLRIPEKGIDVHSRC